MKCLSANKIEGNFTRRRWLNFVGGSLLVTLVIQPLVLKLGYQKLHFHSEIPRIQACCCSAADADVKSAEAVLEAAHWCVFHEILSNFKKVL